MKLARKKSGAKRRDNERLEYGVGAKADPSMFPAGTDLRYVADMARRKFYLTGEQTRGVHLIGRWRNPDKKFGNPDWKTTEDEGQTLAEFRGTILNRIGAVAPTVSGGRSEAARRGAATRKRKRAEKLALAEKRSASARKGWTTRRRNARRKARAEKGKKT
jgi:hypothetical protein